MVQVDLARPCERSRSSSNAVHWTSTVARPVGRQRPLAQAGTMQGKNAFSAGAVKGGPESGSSHSLEPDFVAGALSVLEEGRLSLRGRSPPWTLRPCRRLQLPVPQALRRRKGGCSSPTTARPRCGRSGSRGASTGIGVGTSAPSGPCLAGGDGQRYAGLWVPHVEPDRCGPAPAVRSVPERPASLLRTEVTITIGML